MTITDPSYSIKRNGLENSNREIICGTREVSTKFTNQEERQPVRNLDDTKKEELPVKISDESFAKLFQGFLQSQDEMKNSLLTIHKSFAAAEPLLLSLQNDRRILQKKLSSLERKMEARDMKMVESEQEAAPEVKICPEYNQTEHNIPLMPQLSLKGAQSPPANKAVCTQTNVTKVAGESNGIDKIKETIGFIGAGNMARAIGFGLIYSGIVEPNNMIVSAPSDRNLKLWRTQGVKTTNDNYEVVRNSVVTILGVKPQQFKSTAESIQDASKGPGKVKCFVSVMAGINIASIKQALGPIYAKTCVIRVMPSTPSVVGMGCSTISTEASTDNYYTQLVSKIMSSVGTVDVIPEELIPTVSPLNASGPAFMFLVMEAMADGAVRCGVSREMALKMAAQVMKGAGEMVLKTSKHPGVLKDEVCTPGGQTIAGIHALESSSVRSCFMNAIVETNKKSKELTQIADNKQR